MDLTVLTLDELLTVRQNSSTVEEYRAIDDEISRRYNKFVMKRIEKE